MVSIKSFEYKNIGFGEGCFFFRSSIKNKILKIHISIMINSLDKSFINAPFDGVVKNDNNNNNFTKGEEWGSFFPPHPHPCLVSFPLFTEVESPCDFLRVLS